MPSVKTNLVLTGSLRRSWADAPDATEELSIHATSAHPMNSIREDCHKIARELRDWADAIERGGNNPADFQLSAMILFPESLCAVRLAAKLEEVPA